MNRACRAARRHGVDRNQPIAAADHSCGAPGYLGRPQGNNAPSARSEEKCCWAAWRAGLGPLPTDGPLTPVDSPLGLALAAVGARPRQFGQGVDEETAKPTRCSSTLSSQA